MKHDSQRGAWTEHFAKQGVSVEAPVKRPDHHKALGRLKAGVRNQTEAAYERHLELRRQAGEVLWYAFEAVTFKLATDCRYTPDFVVMTQAGLIELHEVKPTTTRERKSGERVKVPYAIDDSKVKIRVAAAQMPFVFKMVYRVAGNWQEDEF